MNQTELKKYLHYDPETGVFTRACPAGAAKVGAATGAVGSHGYLVISVLNKRHLAHRLAALYMTGELPPSQVDHINGDRTDNRWCNLRLATSSMNSRNMAKNSNNTSGVPGVSWHKQRKKWRATMKINGKQQQLYYGDNPFMAVYRRALAEHKYNFHPNHGR